MVMSEREFFIHPSVVWFGVTPRRCDFVVVVHGPSIIIVFPLWEGTRVEPFQGFFFLSLISHHGFGSHESRFPTEETGMPPMVTKDAGINPTITTTLWAFDHLSVPFNSLVEDDQQKRHR